MDYYCSSLPPPLCTNLPLDCYHTSPAAAPLLFIFLTTTPASTQSATSPSALAVSSSGNKDKKIFMPRSQQPTCNFLRWLKAPNSFQIPMDWAASFEHPHQLPQPLTLLLQLLLLLLALLLGQACWVHAEVKHFGFAGVIVTLCARNNRSKLSNRSQLQEHPTVLLFAWRRKRWQHKACHLCSNNVLFQQPRPAEPGLPLFRSLLWEEEKTHNLLQSLLLGWHLHC